MSILKQHRIKRTPENIAAVEKIVRGVPRRGMPVTEPTREAAQRLMRELNRDGWDGLQVFDLLPFKVDEEVRGDRYGLGDPDPIPLPVVEALHAFYCEQTARRTRVWLGTASVMPEGRSRTHPRSGS